MVWQGAASDGWSSLRHLRAGTGCSRRGIRVLIRNAGGGASARMESNSPYRDGNLGIF